MSIKVLITAGGTCEAIDDVRIFEMREVVGNLTSLSHLEVANISKGGFGKRIAEEFTLQGAEVTLLCRWDLIKSITDPSIKTVPFRSFEDLQREIFALLEKKNFDIILMAAAVSDYSPVKVEGKISSDSDEFNLKFKRNPKLLSELREKSGSNTMIVGFKLLSGVPEETLINVARKQNSRASLDFTVANDMKKIDWVSKRHPIILVGAKGNTTSMDGHRKDVTKKLVQTLIEAK